MSVSVGRLAPSPTGGLHMGHARSFLLAWWLARSKGARVVLRIEDLDQTRVRPGSAEACQRDLEWLGLDWDGEPLVQSRDLEPYALALQELEESGQVYPCICSRREIREAVRAPHDLAGEVPYPGTCRDRFDSPADAHKAGDGPVGMRFRAEPGRGAFEDLFAGRQEFDCERHVSDFLVARRDGVFAYQLAVVVDDARQGVTQVLRGADLLSSTPRQWALQEALGLPHPEWIHVPLVVDASGRRLAKRSGDRTLSSMRESGVDPRGLVGWIARSAGIAVDGAVAAAEVVASFDIARLSENDVVFGDSAFEELSKGTGSGKQR